MSAPRKVSVVARWTRLPVKNNSIKYFCFERERHLFPERSVKNDTKTIYVHNFYFLVTSYFMSLMAFWSGLERDLLRDAG